MEIIKEKKTGMIRHIYGTVDPLLCRKCIFESGLVRKCIVNGKEVKFPIETEKNDNVIFDVAFKGKIMNVMSRNTLVDIIGLNDKLMFELYEKIGGKKWEYDDLGSRTDYLTQADKKESW